MHRITGTIYQTSVAQVQAWVDAWIGDTRRRDRLFGVTWEHTGAGVELHLEVSDPQQAVCCLDARIEASRDECVAFIDKMIQALVAADMLYAVTYEEWQGDNVVGEEQRYVHPDFERRYRLFRDAQSL